MLRLILDIWVLVFIGIHPWSSRFVDICHSIYYTVQELRGIRNGLYWFSFTIY